MLKGWTDFWWKTALNTYGSSLLCAEKCVWCQRDHIWGNYVFCGQRASSSKAISSLSNLKQASIEIAVWAAEVNIPETMWGCVYCLEPQLLDMKIFVDTDSDIRLVRRLRRDITERGRDIEGVIKQYNKFVKPAFEQYIEPTMRLADIVVPRGETKSWNWNRFCSNTPRSSQIGSSCLPVQVVEIWWPSIW